MPDHDATVAAEQEVQALPPQGAAVAPGVPLHASLLAVLVGPWREVLDDLRSERWYAVRAKESLAALSAAGIRCLYVPEGVEVEHGARLVALGDEWCGRPVLGIEDTP